MTRQTYIGVFYLILQILVAYLIFYRNDAMDQSDHMTKLYIYSFM